MKTFYADARTVTPIEVPSLLAVGRSILKTAAIGTGFAVAVVTIATARVLLMVHSFPLWHDLLASHLPFLG